MSVPTRNAIFMAVLGMALWTWGAVLCETGNRLWGLSLVLTGLLAYADAWGLALEAGRREQWQRGAA